MGFAVRVRSAGQKYGPTCHQRDRADVTEFVTLVRLSSLGQHVGVLALAGYKRRKSALAANPIKTGRCLGSYLGLHRPACREHTNRDGIYSKHSYQCNEGVLMLRSVGLQL